MRDKKLLPLTAMFLFWTVISIWFGIEQGRQQPIDGKVKCVAVYQGERK